MKRSSILIALFLLFPVSLFNLARGRAIMDLGPVKGPTAAPTPENPRVVEGRRLYQDLKCSYCHRIKGEGGRTGPALDTVGGRRVPEWLYDHFRDPQKTDPASKMARIPLSDQQMLSLTAYMGSLGGRGFSPEAPVLFKKHCASCHSMNAGGADHPLELGAEGRYRDLDFIVRYIRDARAMNKKSLMKPYRNLLTKAQIHDLAVYVSHGGD